MKYAVRSILANDVSESNGKQIEFCQTIAEQFFGIGANQDSAKFNFVFIPLLSNQNIGQRTKTFNNVELIRSPIRRDYKIYGDANNKIKEYFRDLNLTKESAKLILLRNEESSTVHSLIISTDNKLLELFNANDNRAYAIEAIRTQAESVLLPRNRIIFGAPGTGKSYRLEKDRDVFSNNYERVTFHPDYSFAQFVGSYKPVSENGLIEYKYVPGPFIRILLKAYKNTIKQFAEQMDPVFFYSGEVKNSSYYVAPCNVSDWNYFQNAQYVDQIEPWRNPPKDIKIGDVVYIFIGSTGLNKMGYTKDAGIYAIAKAVSESYTDPNDKTRWVDIQYKALSFSKPIIEENEFKADNPTNAIQNFQSKNNGKDLLEKLIQPIPATENYLLLIEEINRANVAAVFGNTFQLLDRDETGKSMYPIECSEDMKKYFISQGLYIERIYIPSNMFIWATMNSADQGVFPMDTAFKRRWDFEYIGINDNENDMKESTVVLGTGDQSHKIRWNDLRHKINDFLSQQGINEDKLLGPYFIGRNVVVPQEGKIIDPCLFNSTFKNKVLMYLFEDAARQKRSALFSGVDRKNSYSSICEAFDSKGMLIFNEDIFSKVEKL